MQDRPLGGALQLDRAVGCSGDQVRGLLREDHGPARCNQATTRAPLVHLRRLVTSDGRCSARPQRLADRGEVSAASHTSGLLHGPPGFHHVDGDGKGNTCAAGLGPHRITALGRFTADDHRARRAADGSTQRGVSVDLHVDHRRNSSDGLVGGRSAGRPVDRRQRCDQGNATSLGAIHRHDYGPRCSVGESHQGLQPVGASTARRRDRRVHTRRRHDAHGPSHERRAQERHQWKRHPGHGRRALHGCGQRRADVHVGRLIHLHTAFELLRH